MVNNGLGDVSSGKVLPADGLLVLRCVEQGVVSLEPVGNARLVEPSNKTLRDQGTNRLCCIASMVKVVQMDGEKTSLKRETVWVWATEEVGVLFMNCTTVWAAVVLKVIVTIYFVASREPPVDILQYLLGWFFSIVCFLSMAKRIGQEISF